MSYYIRKLADTLVVPLSKYTTIQKFEVSEIFLNKLILSNLYLLILKYILTFDENVWDCLFIKNENEKFIKLDQIEILSRNRE